MEPPNLRPALGNFASGDRFWDRKQEVREIQEYLLDGESVLLTGPRRIGKTSVVRRVLTTLDERDVHTVCLDVEKHKDPTEMFADLAAAASADDRAWQRIRGWFGRRLGNAVTRLDRIEVGILKVELQRVMAGSWREDAGAIIAALAEREAPTVLAVDELPLLVGRIMKRDLAESELFMSSLRGFAGDYPNVRWLVSGSIGLEPVLHRAGLTSTINHLRSYPIGPWDRDTAVGAIKALARSTGLDLDDETATHAYDLLGLGVPYHVQLFMDEIRRDARRRGENRVTVADTRRVYAGPFLTSAVQSHLLHLESRLRDALGGDDALRLATDLLTQAAVTGCATAEDAHILAADLVKEVALRPQTLREVLAILEHDAYLVRGEGGWRFCSQFVRDWWHKQYALGFVPAADRRRA